MSKPKDFLSRFGVHCLALTPEIRVTERFACEVFDPTLEQLHRAVQQRMCAALIARRQSVDF